MSVTHTQIEEFDSVVLTEALDGWPAGTRGVVQGAKGSSRLVQITEYDESRDMLDHIMYVDLDQIRLTHKHRRRDSGD
jgi:hypothetical protein